VGYLSRLFRATEEENRRTILRMLAPSPGARLLDLGTGDGTFTLRVAARLRAARVVGVELVEEHAAAAGERGIEMHWGDLEDGLPFESETFDVVHANQVIEHVRRTDRLLDEVRRVLAPGGLVCISTNNLASWHNVASLALGWQPMPMHVSDELILGNPLNPESGEPHADAGRTHLRLFTGRALEELCAHHGLERISLRTTGYYPLPPRLARIVIRLDPLHGAFLVGMFEACLRQAPSRAAARAAPKGGSGSAPSPGAGASAGRAEPPQPGIRARRAG
jgi:methionine biosynthesis protein MetW